jgi:hypothetical protein
MTEYDLVELRAELLSQKTVLAYCLTAIARNAEDPVALLDALAQLFVPRIRDASPAFALPTQRPHFEKTAIGALASIIEAAKQNFADPKPGA